MRKEPILIARIFSDCDQSRVAQAPVWLKAQAACHATAAPVFRLGEP
jgi:hypothetical protein